MIPSCERVSLFISFKKSYSCCPFFFISERSGSDTLATLKSTHACRLGLSSCRNVSTDRQFLTHVPVLVTLLCGNEDHRSHLFPAFTLIHPSLGARELPRTPVVHLKRSSNSAAAAVAVAAVATAATM